MIKMQGYAHTVEAWNGETYVGGALWTGNAWMVVLVGGGVEVVATVAEAREKLKRWGSPAQVLP